MAERNLAVEVVVSWDGNPLDTTLVTAPLSIGPGAGAWFGLPREVLSENHELVSRADDGGWILCAPPEAELMVARAGRVIVGERRVKLTDSTTAEVRLGRFAFFVRASDAAIEQAPRLATEWRWMRWLGAAAVLHGIFLAMFAMSPPAAGALNLDPTDAATRYLTIRLDGVERTPVPPPVQTASAGDAGGSSDSAGAEGGGESSTPSESSSPGPRRTDGRRQPMVATADNLDQIGVLRVLTQSPMSFGDGSSPYTAGSEQVGPGGLAAVAALNMPGGPRFGAFDMGGTGIGTCDPRRQDCTAGMVGVGTLDTRDPGGPGRVPGLRDRTPGRVPGGLRTLPAETRGGLTQEQVRRTVRQHINEVRFCYEQALVRRPDLEGRVSVQFIISQTGAVQSAGVSSTVNDARVGGCVRDAVTRWTFPRSDGMTAVTYPFLMQAAD